ncbi:hypothetical protein GCM10010399_56040 [Dactylosporangium fulvum]|uniref:histidine kinase n=1 Tax=Dactylosporangium fulvum TaxID=53359 RepID=A0ABY5W3A9_9ACTN|nr:sensor histidine kinase [Dactylosporangium fulvum]UWP82571.1 sensor histidine kinase [Dactylosporangium fulvum]
MASALLTRRLRLVDLVAVDTVLALLLALLCGYAARATPVEGPNEPFWVSLLAGLLIGLPVAARRLRPRAVAVAVVVASAATLTTGVIPSYAAVAPCLALVLVFYTLASSAPQRRTLWLAIIGEAVVGGALAGGDLLWAGTSGEPISPLAAVGYALVVITPAILVGYTVGERRAHAGQVRRELVRQAAIEERLRVARELHDVIAHTMTLIVVKASVGNHVAEANPQEARDALRVIEETGRTAMAEVRRVLDMLREDGSDGGATPGLADLPRLAERAAVGGVDVRLDVRRDTAAGPVPAGVGLAVFRIMQEAVTNVVKHAAPATCHARVVVDPGEVRVEVTDDGMREAVVNGAGHGLIGMRERVALHGGDLSAGPLPGGGFAVTARLPYGGRP